MAHLSIYKVHLGKKVKNQDRVTDIWMMFHTEREGERLYSSPQSSKLPLTKS